MISRDRYQAAFDRIDRLGLGVSHCKTCGIPCMPAGHASEGHPVSCDNCWEVEMRLDGYLRDGGPKARAILVAAFKMSIDEELAAHVLGAVEPKR